MDAHQSSVSNCFTKKYLSFRLNLYEIFAYLWKACAYQVKGSLEIFWRHLLKWFDGDFLYQPPKSVCERLNALLYSWMIENIQIMELLECKLTKKREQLSTVQSKFPKKCIVLRVNDAQALSFKTTAALLWKAFAMALSSSILQLKLFKIWRHENFSDYKCHICLSNFWIPLANTKRYLHLLPFDPYLFYLTSCTNVHEGR